MGYLLAVDCVVNRQLQFDAEKKWRLKIATKLA